MKNVDVCLFQRAMPFSHAFILYFTLKIGMLQIDTTKLTEEKLYIFFTLMTYQSVIFVINFVIHKGTMNIFSSVHFVCTNL